MDTNNKTEQATKRFDWLDRMFFVVPALFALIVIGVGLWVYSNWTPMTAQEGAEFNADADAMISATGAAFGVALGALWDTVQDVAEFLAHGRIDSPFTVVAVCLTVAYVARLRIRRDGLRHTATPQSQVYFIANHEDGTVKIGYSDDPQRRLSDLQMGNHSRLEILATVPGGQEVEGMLHERFADSRIDGEWFDLSSNLREFIQRARDGR